MVDDRAEMRIMYDIAVSRYDQRAVAMAEMMEQDTIVIILQFDDIDHIIQCSGSCYLMVNNLVI